MLAAYKWVDEIGQGQAERREGDRECPGVLGLVVVFLARTAGCLGMRHTHVCGGEWGGGGGDEAPGVPGRGWLDCRDAVQPSEGRPGRHPP